MFFFYIPWYIYINASSVTKTEFPLKLSLWLTSLFTTLFPFFSCACSPQEWRVWGLPWWFSGLPQSAYQCRGHGFNSWSGRISHDEDQLKTQVPQLLNLCSRAWAEKAMATHSSTLAWKIPWMEEPGRLQSMGSLESTGHDWATSLSLFTVLHWRRKWRPTPVFLPGESQGRRSRQMGCSLWGRTELDTTEVT